MTSPIRSRTDGFVRSTSLYSPQQPAQTPAAQNTVAPEPTDTSAQYRASVEQSTFEGPVATTT